MAGILTPVSLNPAASNSADKAAASASKAALAAASASKAALAAASIVPSNLVHISGTETITGIKTLTSPVINTPTGITASDVGAIPTSRRGTANGVAGLDANLEVIKPQTGAAAQVALGRAGARKRADGTWDGVAIHLPNGYDLHLWADDLVSGQTYYVFSPVNAPSGGDWHLEVLRYVNDAVGNQYRTIRLTAMVGTAYPNGTVLTSSNANGTWGAWEKFNIGGGSGWQPVTLLNGNSKGPADHFGIRKTPDGTVTVAGIIRTVVNGTLFNIPAGYIPNVMIPGATTMYTPAQNGTGGQAYSNAGINSTSFIIFSSSASWIMINHSWQVI